MKGSGRFDSVVTALDETRPGATRFYLELQDRHQSDLLLRLHMKILIRVVHRLDVPADHPGGGGVDRLPACPTRRP